MKAFFARYDTAFMMAGFTLAMMAQGFKVGFIVAGMV